MNIFPGNQLSKIGKGDSRRGSRLVVLAYFLSTLAKASMIEPFYQNNRQHLVANYF